MYFSIGYFDLYYNYVPQDRMLTLLRTVKFQHIILTTAWVHGVIMPLRSWGAQSTHNLYDVKPLKIGVEIFGVDLQKDVTDDIKV